MDRSLWEGLCGVRRAFDAIELDLGVPVGGRRLWLGQHWPGSRSRSRPRAGVVPLRSMWARPVTKGGLKRGLEALCLVCAVQLAAGAALGAEPGESDTETRASFHGAVFADPLGLAMFGPVLGGELAFGKPAAALYVRWLDGGWLARRMFPDDEAGEQFAFSYGAGLKGRYYFSAGLTGPFAGVAAEYLRSRIENDSLLIATNAQYLVPQVEAGYRHGLGSFLIGGTAALGYAFEIGNDVEDLPGGSQASLYQVQDESTIYGSVGLEVGVGF